MLHGRAYLHVPDDGDDDRAEAAPLPEGSATANAAGREGGTRACTSMHGGASWIARSRITRADARSVPSPPGSQRGGEGARAGATPHLTPCARGLGEATAALATMGDPAGIGGELTVRPGRHCAAAGLLSLPSTIRPVARGPARRSARSAAPTRPQCSPTPCRCCRAAGAPRPGRPDAANAPATIASIERAVRAGAGGRGCGRRHQPDQQGRAVRRRLRLPRPHRVPRAR